MSRNAECYCQCSLDFLRCAGDSCDQATFLLSGAPSSNCSLVVVSELVMLNELKMGFQDVVFLPSKDTFFTWRFFEIVVEVKVSDCHIAEICV